MDSKLRLLPIGGIGNVTKNMYVYEYEDQILIVDCGIGFPEASMLGVDVLIPDVTYLQQNLDKIQAMLLTHGHDDHIAGLPYVLPQLNADFPIYGSTLTVGMAKDRVKEFSLEPDFRVIPDTTFDIGPFKITPIKMTHSVPDTRHYVIKTPAATVYHGSDFKFDLNPVDGVIPDFQAIAKAGMDGVDLLMSDCLNAENQGFSASESTLTDLFEREIRGVAGKFIVTIMSSNLHRIQQIINVSAAHNRNVAFVGRSVEQNVKTATELRLLKLPKTVINKRDINKHPAKNLTVIIAGSQGQEGSSLTRAAAGEHDLIKINHEDKVVFASEPIPGNENNVYATIDALSRTGAEVTYSDIDDSVHVSGHSSATEQKLLIALTTPKAVVPIGGTYHHMIQYRQLARSMGYKDNRILLLNNGEMMEIDHQITKVAEKMELKNIMVDGLGIGDVGPAILYDRKKMATDGVLIVIVPVEETTSQVRGEIEVISRGFVFMKESSALVEQIKDKTIDCLIPFQGKVADWQELRHKIEKSLEKFTYSATERQPLILPVIIEV
jgi:ribonuclease J